ncbi:inactive N-acetylated-alpha-linked acidic dipeptidase-like protein 2 [Cricetulus griseus]|uniref:Inactive N-acetylated-alpha-linked acidic dipeptidase-like protein 2 n=1 Tax=Cricetulus griseus TaxID=10029 RepID=A0A061IMI4_CRIGR|nr:inactive N-acetylated-alpha-linked acidic dipeptidase-like protein 2 [Cricetulus griseus]
MKNKFYCSRRAQCPGANVSAVQIQGDTHYFINHLGVPTVQFAYEDLKALEGPSFLSEAIFPKHATKIEEVDPSFTLHEAITKFIHNVDYIDQFSYNEPSLHLWDEA